MTRGREPGRVPPTATPTRGDPAQAAAPAGRNLAIAS